jgi:integrase
MSTAPKSAALEYIATLKAEPEKRKKLTFSELFNEWYAVVELNLSKSSLSSYRNCYNKYCFSLKHRQIAEIRTPELQACINNCNQSPRMKQYVKVTLTSMFKYAEQNDYVEKNYAKFIKVPALTKPDKDAFTESEINAIWTEYDTGNDFMRYALIMIYAGLRPAELRQLSDKRIHLDERYIVAGVKTDSGIDREIPINEKLVPLFNGASFGFERNDFYKKYREAFEITEIRYLSPHCCRHTTATALVLAGVDPNIIKEILGHSSFAVTSDNYVHVPREEKIKAINKLQ